MGRWSGRAIAVTLLLATPSNAQLVPAIPSCTLTINPGGAMQIAMDGKTLGSQNLGGRGATMLVGSVNMVPELILSAPTLLGPPGWSASPSTLLSVDTLSGGHIGYTAGRIAIRTNPAGDTLTVNARITNNGGFKAGSYSVSTTVTCQAA